MTVTNEFGRADLRFTMAEQTSSSPGRPQPRCRWFVTGARQVDVLSAEVAQPDGIAVFGQESGRFSGGWGITIMRVSGGHTVDI